MGNTKSEASPAASWQGMSPAGLASQFDRRARATLALTLLFWIFAFAMLTVRAAVTESLPFHVLGIRRFWIALFGAAMCLGMARLLNALHTRSFGERVVWGVAGAFAMALLLTIFGLSLNRIILPVPGAIPITFDETVQWVILWLGYFLAWTGTQLALTYHWEAEERQANLVAVVELSQKAKMAALRYQIGPHFLFNALNSISSLVLERKNEEAEHMLLNLSTFLRSTLSIGSGGLISLEEELELQLLYLTIEQVRFEGRLTTRIEVPAELRSAKVPALILQPLVENAVLHGVGASEGGNMLTISAATDAKLLTLTVEDIGNERDRRKRGGGVGLANVRERLAVHYGSAAELRIKPLGDSGFRAEISLPLERSA